MTVQEREALMYLLTKQPALLREDQVCQSDKLVDRGPGQPAGPCTRPIWKDGKVDGVEYNLCSHCWHEFASFHSGYHLFQANPAASRIDDAALARLFVTRGMDGDELDDLGMAA
jgi:hypothetical protein